MGAAAGPVGAISSIAGAGLLGGVGQGISGLGERQIVRAGRLLHRIVRPGAAAFEVHFFSPVECVGCAKCKTVL
jgi:hypothetical protein